jgi:hypothetical protein
LPLLISDYSKLTEGGGLINMVKIDLAGFREKGCTFLIQKSEKSGIIKILFALLLFLRGV